MEEALLFGRGENEIFLKARGHITARHCPALRDRTGDLENGEGVPRDFFVDLSECDYMDSTFIGVLAGINKRLRKGGKRLILVAPREECVKLLRGLGVYSLFSVTDAASAPVPGPLERLSAGEDTSAELLLRAHEELMELSPENRKRFEVLQGILRAKIRGSGNE